MTSRNNLPAQLTSFIGREQEIAEVKRLLGMTRLLTLTGAGGCGKTRLALEVAKNLSAQYPDGVWFVDLSSLSDETLVPQAVASSLGVWEVPDRPLTFTLIEYLQPLNVLLLIDNCEHLVEACRELTSTLLKSCPGLQIAATSRQALGTPGEIAWPVPSLSVPDPQETYSVETLAQYEAVALFIDRALFRRPDFSLKPENVTAVAQLCHRLDGIPLAIELAAARVKVLSVEQIVSRLDERFRLLVGGTHVTLPRHQTLRALMDWSHDLLSESEQALLRSLSVFAGGFTLEAVEAVCGGFISVYELIELLSHLVDKSLLVMEERGGEAHYRLLETIRQYVEEKLESAGETSGLRRRHFDYYLRLAEESEDELLTDKQALWLARLEEQHDNLRAALAWSKSEAPKDEVELRLAGALTWFWYFHAYITEGRGWIEGALRHAGTTKKTAPHAKALSAGGLMAYVQSDYTKARLRLEEALSVWRLLDHERGTAITLTFLGRVAVREGNYTEARAFLEESAALFRQARDSWGLALSLDSLGEVALELGDRELATTLHGESLALHRERGHKWGIALELGSFGRVAMELGDYAAARAGLQEALYIQREIGDKWATARILHNLAEVALFEGDYEQAGVQYAESLALFQHLGDRRGIAESLHMLGHIAHHQGEQMRAEGLFHESLVVASELGDKVNIGLCLIELARVAGAVKQPERAARLYGAAQALLMPNNVGRGISVASLVRNEFESDMASIKMQHNKTHWEQALAAGSEMPLEQAIEFALHKVGDSTNIEVVIGDWSAANSGSTATKLSNHLDDLTEREAEVLRLIAQGLTDAQVAERLYLSTRTVQSHARSIYSKLGISTRSGATRYAIEHKLV
ncbi:MAG: tetratricopeptide repeat protein [Chloroflexia bacterium]